MFLVYKILNPYQIYLNFAQLDFFFIRYFLMDISGYPVLNHPRWKVQWLCFYKILWQSNLPRAFNWLAQSAIFYIPVEQWATHVCIVCRIICWMVTYTLWYYALGILFAHQPVGLLLGLASSVSGTYFLTEAETCFCFKFYLYSVFFPYLLYTVQGMYPDSLKP